MFTMPITTNKPVNFISFSIVLLFIMGICLCISPDIAYAVDQEPSLPPADAFAPALQLAIPEPPTGDGQAWVAISNGTQVRVFYLFMQHAGFEGDAVIVGSSFSDGFRLSDVNVSGKTITFNIGMPADLTYYYSVSKWDSESTKFVNVEINQAASGQNNRTFSTGYTPSYIAFGGNISYSESLSIKSFVPIFSDNGYDENRDLINGMLAIEADVEASAESLVKLRENLALVVRDVDDIRVESVEANASLIALRENLALVVRDVDDLRVEAEESNASLIALRENLALVVRDVDDIRVDTDELNTQFTSFRSDFALLVSDVSDILISLEGLSADFDSLASSMNSLQESFDDLLNQFSTLSEEMAELTAAINAETEIWEAGKSDYKYDQVDDHSVSAFSKLWDWLINPFMSLFASSAPNGLISYDVESLDPESVVTRQLSVGQYFQDVFFNSDTVDPSYPDLGDIDFGGLP